MYPDWRGGRIRNPGRKCGWPDVAGVYVPAAGRVARSGSCTKKNPGRSPVLQSRPTPPLLQARRPGSRTRRNPGGSPVQSRDFSGRFGSGQCGCQALPGIRAGSQRPESPGRAGSRTSPARTGCPGRTSIFHKEKNLHLTSMKAQPRYGCVPCCTWGDNLFVREFFRDYDGIGNPGNTNRFNTGVAAGRVLRWCHCTLFSGKAGMCRMHTGGAGDVPGKRG